MKSKFFLQLISAVLILACVTPVFAAGKISKTEALSWAETRGAELLDAFRMKDAAERYRELDRLFDENIDTGYISRFVVGKYWRTMSAQQQKRYGRIFERYLKAMYKSFPLDFADTLQYKVTGASVAEDFTVVTANVLLTLNGQPQEYMLQFRLHRPADKILLVDIKIMESSLILSARSKFYQMIASVDGEIEWFLEDLELDALAYEKKNTPQGQRQ